MADTKQHADLALWRELAKRAKGPTRTACRQIPKAPVKPSTPPADVPISSSRTRFRCFFLRGPRAICTRPAWTIRRMPVLHAESRTVSTAHRGAGRWAVGRLRPRHHPVRLRHRRHGDVQGRRRIDSSRTGDLFDGSRSTGCGLDDHEGPCCPSSQLIARARSRACRRRSSRDHQNDILKEFMSGHVHLSPAPSIRIVADHRVHREGDAEVQLISISGYHMQEAGATSISSWVHHRDGLE